MFSESGGDVVNILPTWKNSRVSQDGAVQTFPREYEERGLQCPDVCDAQVQTSAVEMTEETASYDVAALGRFLERVVPAVWRQLEANQKSRAFSNYRLLSESANASSRRLHHLCHPSLDEVQCSAVSWNNTGSLLAVGYGRGMHEGWCSHGSGLALWNVARSSPEKPREMVETEGCVSNLSFHPHCPSVLAVGQANGEVLVLDFSKEDNVQMVSSVTSQDAHQEAVTGLHWVVGDSHSGKYGKLFSCSLDGKILLWDWKDGCLQANHGFLLLTEDVPFRIRSQRPGSRVGVTCFSFNGEDESLFVVGTEGGALFQCSSAATKDSKHSLGSGVPMKSPLGMSFEVQEGYVRSVEFCPSARNLFASAASSGQLRVHTLLQPQPVSTIRCNSELTCVRWSPSRPVVLATSTTDGEVFLYDLRQCSSPVESFATDVGIADFQFNRLSPDMLACGGMDGRVQVWELAPHLHSPSAGQSEWLLQLASTG